MTRNRRAKAPPPPPPIPSPPHIAGPARAALEHALASGADVILIAWETNAKLCHAAVPKSQALARGLISDLGVLIHNPAESIEEDEE